MGRRPPLLASRGNPYTRSFAGVRRRRHPRPSATREGCPSHDPKRSAEVATNTNTNTTVWARPSSPTTVTPTFGVAGLVPEPHPTGTGSKRVPSEPVRGPRGCPSRDPARGHSIVVLLSLRFRRIGRRTPSSMSHRSKRHPLQPLTGLWRRSPPIESARPRRLRAVNRLSAAARARAAADGSGSRVGHRFARHGHAHAHGEPTLCWSGRTLAHRLPPVCMTDSGRLGTPAPANPP